MHSSKEDMWKACIAIAGVLFLLVFIVWIPATSVGAHERILQSTPTATLTVDATITALNKEKLQHENDWWWNYGATILTSIFSTLTLAAAGMFAIVRYFNDRRDAREKQEEEAKRLAEDRKAERERRDEEQQRWLKDQDSEREKRAEERFQAVVEGLSSKREEAKIGAAITLRTFLRPGYEQFYRQVFDLAVAHLRLPRAPLPLDDRTPTLQMTTLSRALIAVFKEAFPLARSQKQVQSLNEVLDASRIRLDHAYLVNADLYQAWLLDASLKQADFGWANFQDANFYRANLQGSYAPKVNFSKSYLRLANLSKARLEEAKMVETIFEGANLSSINLKGADLNNANFIKADLSGANLSNCNLTGTNLEEALSLKDTNLRGAKGLSKSQLDVYKAKGAIIDEDAPTNASQPAASSSEVSQGSDIQDTSDKAAQIDASSPRTDGSSTSCRQDA